VLTYPLSDVTILGSVVAASCRGLVFQTFMESAYSCRVARMRVQGDAVEFQLVRSSVNEVLPNKASLVPVQWLGAWCESERLTRRSVPFDTDALRFARVLPLPLGPGMITLRGSGSERCDLSNLFAGASKRLSAE